MERERIVISRFLALNYIILIEYFQYRIDFQSIFRAGIFNPEEAEEEALNSTGVTARYKNYIGVGLGSLSKVGPPWLTTEGLPKFKLGSNLLDILCTFTLVKTLQTLLKLRQF